MHLRGVYFAVCKCPFFYSTPVLTSLKHDIVVLILPLTSVTYRCPVCSDLPFTADLQLASARCLWLLQVLTAMWLHCMGAVSIDMPAQDLTVLHSQSTGLTALGPFSYVPAKE